MKFYSLGLVLCCAMFLYGCGSGCDRLMAVCYEGHAARDTATVHQFSMVALDSMIALNDSIDDGDAVRIKSHYEAISDPYYYYRNVDYPQMDFSSVEFIPFAIEVTDVPLIFMDVYGCDDQKCSNANKIVFHDREFNYVEVLKEDSFTFSKNPLSYYYENFGDDCKLMLSLFFNLKIRTPRIKIDVDLQDAVEACQVEDN